MENIEGEINSVGVTVVKSDVHTEYHVADRTEFPNLVAENLSPATSQAVFSPAVTTIPTKKKRGRPRKYGPDAVLSPKPLSSSVPSPVIDFSSEKRVKVRPVAPSSKQQHKTELENLGEWVACSVGADFTPHIITVNSGEDVTMKIISFSQQGPRAICILSANGVISSVTLRQPDSSGGTLTYEGRFEILSLSGSFMLSDSGGTRSRSGGISVSLAGPDGRVLGGGIAGLLVAASPVQIVIGSFLTVSKHEQKQQKKDKTEFISMARVKLAVPISSVQMEDPYGNNQAQHNYSTPKNWSLISSDSRTEPTDINATVPGG